MKTPFCPEHDPDWQECHQRVSAYLLAHGLEDPDRRRHVAAAILLEARKEYLVDDTKSRLATTYAVLEGEMARWFRAMPGLNSIPDTAVLVTGRLFWRLGNDGGRWSNYFLSREKLPGELSAQLASLDSLWPPELNVSVMIPREPPSAREVPAEVNADAPWSRLLVVLATFILAAATLWHLL